MQALAHIKQQQPSAIPIIGHGRIDQSSIHGHGLFATSAIAANTKIGVLDGQIVPLEYIRQSGQELSLEWNALPGGKVLVRPIRTSYFYINHSRSPNLKLRHGAAGQLLVWTRRAIECGEEMLLDYRDEPLDEAYLLGHGASYL